MIDYFVDGHVATVRINNPEALNAVSSQDMADLLQVWRRFGDDEQARVAVLTGAGDRSFCAGANVKELGARSSAADQRAAFWGQADRGVGSTIEDRLPLWKPVIAAINGYCVGEGLVMSLGADMRICSTNATFALTEVKIGINTVTGAIILPQMIPSGIAAELAFTGDFIDADRALRCGLVNAVYESADLMTEAYALANRIAEQAPLAVRAIKEVMVKGRTAPFDVAMTMGEGLRALVRESQDYREGVAAFAEKRKPHFVGK